MIIHAQPAVTDRAYANVPQAALSRMVAHAYLLDVALVSVIVNSYRAE